MTTTADRTDRAGTQPRRPGRGLRLLQLAGWTLIVAGAVVGLYVVYALFFTNLETGSAQRDMLEEWDRTVGAVEANDDRGAAEASEDDDRATEEPEQSTGVGAASPETPAARDLGPDVPDLGGAVARLEFVRPGSDESPVQDDPLLIVGDVTWDALRRGPGHYPSTSLPGEDGNFAVAGHRTTYGAPFFHLDRLDAGDEIHVTDRTGTTHVYAFTEQRVVGPADTWVLDPEAIDSEAPLLTLTTCHPRFSDRYRLVVFAELVA